MNKSKIFAICYVIGILILLALVLLMFLITFLEKYFDKDKYIYILLIGGIGLMLTSLKDMFTENKSFSYGKFRAYFTFFLGTVCIILFIYLKLCILK